MIGGHGVSLSVDTRAVKAAIEARVAEAGPGAAVMAAEGAFRGRRRGAMHPTSGRGNARARNAMEARRGRLPTPPGFRDAVIAGSVDNRAEKGASMRR